MPQLSTPYFLWLFLSFQGRLPRLGFWLGALVIIAVVYVLESWVELMAGERFTAFVSLASIWPSAALVSKRLNDRGMEQKWLWLFVAPDFVVTTLVVMQLLERDKPVSPALSLVVLAGLVITLALIVELGLKKGEAGPNAHGPEPK